MRTKQENVAGFVPGSSMEGTKLSRWVSVQVRRVRESTSSYGSTFFYQSCIDMCRCNYADLLEADALLPLSFSLSFFSLFMTCPLKNVLNKTLLLHCARQ